jgi:hypothetical protein
MHSIKLVLVMTFIALGLSAPAIAQTSMSSVTTAVPVAVDYGPASSMAAVRLSVLRGLVNADVFSVRVTVGIANDLSLLGDQEVLLSETSVFGFDKSQAVIAVGGWGTDVIPNSVIVCATIIQTTGAGDTVFSEQICEDLVPQDP